MGIMVNTEDRDGAPWGMGHMSKGAHGQHVCVVMCLSTFSKNCDHLNIMTLPFHSGEKNTNSTG